VGKQILSHNFWQEREINYAQEEKRQAGKGLTKDLGQHPGQVASAANNFPGAQQEHSRHLV